MPVVGSLCSLTRSLSGTFSDADHTAYIASHWLDVAEQIVARTADTRARHPEAAFLDVEYGELLTEPLAVISRIYAFDGIELTPEVEDRMQEYLADNQQGKFGRHSYSLDEFGLREDEIRERLARA